MATFTSLELSNEDYHARPEVSGSTLAAIYSDCPAAWKFGDKEPTPAMEEGTATHAALLEPELFDATYKRGLDITDYSDALTTTKDMQAFLKARGIKGGSNKTKTELIAMILETCENDHPIIWDLVQQEFEQKNSGFKILAPELYDRIYLMRTTIFNDPEYSNALTGAQLELSSILPKHNLKARWDIVTKDGEIWDYKTTTTAHPEAFGRKAHDLGYWLKMAFQADVYELEFGEKPKRVVLLAHSKKKPYIPQAYALTPEQLDIGREQCRFAWDQYNRALESNTWPAYGGGVRELFTPEYLAKKYDF